MEKSEFCPTHKIEFLGFILNSTEMTIKLTEVKADKIKNLGLKILNMDKIKIRDLAGFIGNVVAAGESVQQAPLKYKYLEILRNEALKENCGNFDAPLHLDKRAKCLIHWWTSNIHSCFRSLQRSNPDLSIYTDASLSGWGACSGGNITSGHWDALEKDHINILELKAVLFGLKALMHNVRCKHIRIKSDNNTVIASINNQGSVKMKLLDVTEKIFEWAKSGTRISSS